MFTVDNLLPIGLSDFKAELISSTVRLTWETQSERDNDYFSIQHSMDGQEFQEIGTEKGAGSSLVPIKYNHLHINPSSGLNYYRLKQVDFNGKAEFSDVVSVRWDHQGIQVYPNPVEEEWFVVFSGETFGENRIELFDASGRKCFEIMAETKITSIGREGLASGIYLLRVSTPEKLLTRKLILR